MNKFEPNLLSDGEGPAAPYPADDIDIGLNSNFDQVLRTAIISILMVWVFIAVIAGLYDTESRPFPP